MGNSSTKKVAYIGLLSALTFVFTMYLKVTLPANGYFNLGVIVIVLASCLFGWKYGALAGAIGASIADLLIFPAWIPYTIFVKVAIAVFVYLGYKSNGLIKWIYYLLGGICSVGGYYIAEAIIFGNWLSPINSTIALVAEYVVCLIIGLILVKRLKFKIK